jgi:uroporphyrin-3 C-methyltransferase
VITTAAGDSGLIEGAVDHFSAQPQHLSGLNSPMSSEIPSLPPLEAAQPAVRRRRLPPWRRPSAIIAAVALALLGWQWVETRSRLADLQEELARRLSDGDTVARGPCPDPAGPGKPAGSPEQGRRLDARFSESQGQQVALEAMYQEFSRDPGPGCCPRSNRP